MSAALAPAAVPHAGPANHSWAPPTTILGPDSDNGCEQHVRICEKCGLIKFTMLPPSVHGTVSLPWTEWSWPGAGRAARARLRPPCPGKRVEHAA